MPFYIKGNKLRTRASSIINKSVIFNYINSSIASRLSGKNPATDRLVYSSQSPYGGVGDAGIWVRNPSCWLNGVSNISCFSPAQRSGANWWQRGGTLITRKHALFAKHFVTSVLPNGGTPLIFVDENNNAIRRNIINYGYDTTDIAIALLDSEVPSNIKIAKVLPKNYKDYISSGSLNSTALDFGLFGLVGVALDQEEKALTKTSSTIDNSIINFDNFSGPNGGINPYPEWTENIIVGDSGNPVFYIIDNELVVLTIWSTPTNGPFITSRYDQVNAIIESLSPGEGYGLTPIDLDRLYKKLTAQPKVLKKTINIDKNIIPNHINVITANKLFGKNSSTDRPVYSSQNPYGGVGDAGIWVRNPNCWLNGVSNISCFSPAQLGVGSWNTRAGTLITKKHALFAKHFLVSILPNGGTPLIFVDENNNAIRRNIISYGYDFTDIAVALLDEEVPSNIKIAKVLPSNYQDYMEILSYKYAIGLDQEEKAILKQTKLSYSGYIVGDGQGGTINVPNIEISSLPSSDPYYTFTEDIVPGDSGNPVFIIIDNELVVLSTWWTPSTCPFITTRYDAVNAIINSLSPGEGYSLTPVDLDLVYHKYS